MKINIRINIYDKLNLYEDYELALLLLPVKNGHWSYVLQI